MAVIAAVRHFLLHLHVLSVRQGLSCWAANAPFGLLNSRNRIMTNQFSEYPSISSPFEFYGQIIGAQLKLAEQAHALALELPYSQIRLMQRLTQIPQTSVSPAQDTAKPAPVSKKAASAKAATPVVKRSEKPASVKKTAAKTANAKVATPANKPAPSAPKPTAAAPKTQPAAPRARKARAPSKPQAMPTKPGSKE
jgi:hypothetical protein